MSLYGDPLFDSILARLRPDIERACGIDLKPTYSFVRVYREGTQLVPHRDRPACEHSVTIHLASAGNGREWQIEFEDLNGDERSLVLDRGDAVVYQGCALRHWRRPCPSTWYAQGFFHYVAATGPHAAEMFDRRRYLGLSKGQEP
jgi:alkylated DNA repair dioxygenase AlkB